MNFRSDNEAGAHPAIIEAVCRAFRAGPVHSYGADQWTQKVEHRLRDIFEKPDLVAYPVAVGTAANVLALACCSPPWGSIFCHPAAHIAAEETNAAAFYSGGAASSASTDRPARSIPRRSPRRWPSRCTASCIISQPVGGQHHAGDRERHRLCAGRDRRPRHVGPSPWAEDAHGRRPLRQCAVVRRLLAGRAVLEGRHRRAEPRRHQERRAWAPRS